MGRSRRSAERGPVTQLATRVPADLRRALKSWCVEADVSMEDFVADALEERLRRLGSQATARRRIHPSRR